MFVKKIKSKPQVFRNYKWMSKYFADRLPVVIPSIYQHTTQPTAATSATLRGRIWTWAPHRPAALPARGQAAPVTCRTASERRRICDVSDRLSWRRCVLAPLWSSHWRRPVGRLASGQAADCPTLAAPGNVRGIVTRQTTSRFVNLTQDTKHKKKNLSKIWVTFRHQSFDSMSRSNLNYNID